MTKELTAEQVREAIFNGSAYASYDGAQYYANGISMQAIADELNTCAERTCNVELNESKTAVICSNCGSSELLKGWSTFKGWDGETRIDTFTTYPYCPNCGARVKMVDE